MKVKFIEIDRHEWMFKFKGNKYLLRESPRGVYGIDKSVILFRLDGFIFTMIKEIGWTKSDNHSCSYFDISYLKGIVTIDECKAKAIEYLEKILN